MFQNAEMMKLFLEEAEEQLQVLERDILALESGGESEALIQTIFRAAHTLKGSSAAMGYGAMKDLTHEMENVLDQVRSGKLGISPTIVNALFECLDHLNRFKGEIESDGTCSGNASELTARLKRLLEQQAGGTVQAVSSSGRFMPLTEEEAAQAAAFGQEGMSILEIDLIFEEPCQMKGARSLILRQQLAEHCHVIAMRPPLEAMENEEGPEPVRYTVAARQTGAELEQCCRHLIESGRIERMDILSESGAVAKRIQKAANRPQSPVPANPEGKEPRRKSGGHTVRVDVERLENLMNLVGELVIDQTRIVQVGTIIRDLIQADDTMDDFDSITNHISRVVGELQESVMKTRMLPIDQLFNRFPRMVRDLSQTLGKQVNLIIEGKETELDRTVIEEIGDPIIHLLRNSIDHGIERPETRLSRGKPETGSIRIKAVHRENQVVLTIEDDGAGIDPARIRQSAIRKGLITEAQASAMTEHEIIHLIFEPGFSTAEQVSDVSGRGVGMDIVRSHIQKLNGIIDVHTQCGEGTCFTIQLPLTLAILPGLLIRIQQWVYALPISSVVEIMRLPRREVHSIKGQTAVKIRDQVIPLVWIHDYFQLSRPETGAGNMFVVIVGAAEKRLALVVDELIGNQEIVVKSMGAYVGKVEGISGATILGDGGVALILDITGIFKLAGKERAGGPEDLAG